VDLLHPSRTVSEITNESRNLDQKNMHAACVEVSDYDSKAQPRRVGYSHQKLMGAAHPIFLNYFKVLFKGYDFRSQDEESLKFRGVNQNLFLLPFSGYVASCRKLKNSLEKVP